MRGQVCSSSCLSNNKVALPRQGAWRRREFGWPIGNAPRKDEPRFMRNSELFTVLVDPLKCLLPPGHNHSLPYAVLGCAALPRPLLVLALKPHAGLASTVFHLYNANGFDCKFDRAGVDAEPSGHGARDNRLIRPHI